MKIDLPGVSLERVWKSTNPVAPVNLLQEKGEGAGRGDEVILTGSKEVAGSSRIGHPWRVTEAPKESDKKACPFCEWNQTHKNSIKERILYETENFYVTPTLGQITPGYLLIIPKGHYSCLGDLPPSMQQELTALKEKVGEELTRKYQKPIFFEHGICGQTVRHAHLHCVPANVDLSGNIAQDYKMSKIDRLEDLKDIFNKEGSYLFLEDRSGQKFVFHTKDKEVKPQYLRIVLAQKLGVPERADWKVYPGWEEIEECKKRLKF